MDDVIARLSDQIHQLDIRITSLSLELAGIKGQREAFNTVRNLLEAERTQREEQEKSDG